MTTEPGTALARLQSAEHPTCIVCGDTNGTGLALDFHPSEPGAVEASFACDPRWQGYDGVLHGGTVCMLLDGAMTNCMFALGQSAVTAELKVRFRAPLRAGRAAAVRAWRESSCGMLHVLAAEVRQDDRVVATATAKFVDKKFAPWSNGDTA